MQLMYIIINRTALIRHQCRKTTFFSCHRCLLKTVVETNEQHLNVDYNFDHQMSLNCWYSNSCLHFLIALFHCSGLLCLSKLVRNNKVSNYEWFWFLLYFKSLIVGPTNSSLSNIFLLCLTKLFC